MTDRADSDRGVSQDLKDQAIDPDAKKDAIEQNMDKSPNQDGQSMLLNGDEKDKASPDSNGGELEAKATDSAPVDP